MINLPAPGTLLWLMSPGTAHIPQWVRLTRPTRIAGSVINAIALEADTRIPNGVVALVLSVHTIPEHIVTAQPPDHKRYSLVLLIDDHIIHDAYAFSTIEERDRLSSLTQSSCDVIEYFWKPLT